MRTLRPPWIAPKPPTLAGGPKRPCAFEKDQGMMARRPTWKAPVPPEWNAMPEGPLGTGGKNPRKRNMNATAATKEGDGQKKSVVIRPLRGFKKYKKNKGRKKRGEDPLETSHTQKREAQLQRDVTFPKQGGEGRLPPKKGRPATESASRGESGKRKGTNSGERRNSKAGI